MSFYENYGFLSYKRGPGSGADAWHSTCQESIGSYLKIDLGEHNVELFFDRHHIAPGAYWMETLRAGLDRSPILLPFFSSGYFRSKICTAELKAFMDREDQLGVDRGTLIHAARTTPDTMFPDWAKGIQAEPMEEFFHIGPTFDSSDIRHDFDVVLKSFSRGAFEKLLNIGNCDALSYRETFPQLPEVPSPVVQDSITARLFGPQATVPKPYSEGTTAS